MFFLNAVLVINVLIRVRMLSGFKRIETELGRLPETRPNAPRPIDIDISMPVM